MRINKHTLMFEGLTLQEFHVLEKALRNLMIKGKSPVGGSPLVGDRTLGSIIDEWLTAFDTKTAGTATSRLLAICHVLPGYLGLSLIQFAKTYGGIPSPGGK